MATIPFNEIFVGTVENQLGEDVPVLPKSKLHQFVEKFFSRKDTFLDLADQHGGPLYILDPDMLERRGCRFRTVFSNVLPDTGFYYAVKSNNHPEVSRTLIRTGFGLDVSSDQELKMALSLGSEDIVFSGPGKSDSELILAVENSEKVVVLLDSFTELYRLQQFAQDRNKHIRVGIRLSTAASGLWQKFGIPAEELTRFCVAAASCTHLFFEGIQFHTSWNLDPEKQILFIAQLGKLLSALPRSVRDSIKFIDIGGGYWPEQGEWLNLAGTKKGAIIKAAQMSPEQDKTHYCLPSQSIECFAKALGTAIEKHLLAIKAYRICFEPGRWISNDAMHLLLRVMDLKGSTIAITDGGTNAIGWERFETDYCPILNLNRPALEEHSCSIMGSLCTPQDLWGYSYWGEDLQIGDILLIPNQGAYTYSLSQNFIKSIPQVVSL
ncbi:MAG: alanine racemase [Desulfocapsaceae bacterium]|jgi:diaminopimelate decarboxylase|nr:alanine racemase [Desulfocapsaceae bacterium]